VTAAVTAIRAQGLVEYGLIMALTAVLTVVIMTVFGGQLADVLAFIADAIEASS
jgi:Flp pilus assembly pilin Flp